MRVIAGSARGRKLIGDYPPGVRPLMDRIKESLFGMLDSRVEGARVLDLCAGSGSFGIEALSRGAKQVCFVESMPELVELLQANLERLGFAPQARVYCETAETFIQATDGTFDLVFIDPPFKSFSAMSGPVTEIIAARRVLAPAGLLVVRFFFKERFNPVGFDLMRDKVYGENKVAFYTQSKESL
jgi:16S rRNA (guanine(966)-N(2))-methyltransferase RsmD